MCCAPSHLRECFCLVIDQLIIVQGCSCSCHLHRAHSIEVLGFVQKRAFIPRFRWVCYITWSFSASLTWSFGVLYWEPNGNEGLLGSLPALTPLAVSLCICDFRFTQDCWLRLWCRMTCTYIFCVLFWFYWISWKRIQNYRHVCLFCILCFGSQAKPVYPRGLR